MDRRQQRQQWLKKLNDELRDSPLVSNAAFGFILMGLEKLVELEFECPCNPKYNAVFSSAFFIIPAVMAFTLMAIVQGCRCGAGRQNKVAVITSSVVPAVVWLVLLFLDGQYFACAMTDWKGRFVIVDNAAPQKWCEPPGEDEVAQTLRLMMRSQELFVISQVIGMALLVFNCLGLIVYIIRRSRLLEDEIQHANNYEMA